MSGEQLPLNVTLRDDCSLESYYAGDNAQAIFQIEQQAKGVGEQYLFIWGRAGVGCSHLLQGACQRANQYNRSAMYLPLHPDKPLSMIDGLEHIDLVCLDDIETIAGHDHWEEALFHLFNRMRTLNQSLLIAADKAPNAIGIQLPDLQSRLSWGITFQIHPLSDEALLKALQLRAKQRGLVLTDEVGTFLIRRSSRDMHALYATLETLDKASLASQRRLTIPFLKETLSF